MYSETGLLKYAETKRLIRQAMVNKQLVLFIGAGASKDSGMPLWGEAIRAIASRMGIDHEKTDTLVIPQYYYNARGNKEYTQLMREIFKYGEKLETKEVHKKIMRFAVGTIITTNYDHLLEQAAEENGVFLDVVARDSDLPYRKAGNELIKMHGDFEHDNFVLKEDDYLQYHKNFKLIENYIKSLIGTKTVLFIGYSLSDPDVKHIFSWVKDILGENFQRAYLINAGDEFNENENDYFKHLGVNLIYSKELLEKPNDDLTENVNKTLDYLLRDDRENESTTEYIYYELKPFADLRYTFNRYIINAIVSKPHTYMYVNNGIITCSKEHSNEDEKDFAKGIAAAICGKQVSEKIKTIYKAIKQSSMKGIIAEKTDGKFEEYLLVKDEMQEYEKAIFEFDYTKLEEIKKKNSAKLSEDNPWLYMEQAAICSFIHDYETAYYCLNNAALSFYKKDQFAWYFIALWNKLHIGQIIKQVERWNTRQKLVAEVENDIKNIDIEKTLQSIPDLGNRNNRFLKDLINFHFSSVIFYDAFRTSKEINTESRKTYMLHTAIPAYDKLRETILDYFMYCTKNCLLVDWYPENSEVYSMYVRSMLSSISAPDKEQETNGFPFESRNYHLRKMESEDIHYIIRYFDSETLISLFEEYNITTIELSDQAKDYIHNIANNIHVISNGDNKRWKVYTFGRILVVLSKIQLDSNLICGILKVLLSLEGTDVLWEMRKEITLFFHAIYDQKGYNEDGVIDYVVCLIDKIIDLFCEEGGMLRNMWGPIVSLLNCCYAAESPYSKTDKILDILHVFPVFAVEISPACSDSINETIKDYYSGINGKARINSDYLYGLLVLYRIIDPDDKLEKKAIDGIHDETEKQKQGIYTFSDGNVLRIFGSLYLEDKLVDKDRFLMVLNETNNENVKWFVNPETYNYDTFKLGWLYEVREKTLKELAQNKEVSKRIKEIFSREYSAGRIDEGIVKIILKYFLNDGNNTEEPLNTEKSPE